MSNFTIERSESFKREHAGEFPFMCFNQMVNTGNGRLGLEQYDIRVYNVTNPSGNLFLAHGMIMKSDGSIEFVSKEMPGRINYYYGGSVWELD